MRLGCSSPELLLARVPGWVGGTGAGCWELATNTQKQLTPRRAITRIVNWMPASIESCSVLLTGIAPRRENAIRRVVEILNGHFGGAEVAEIGHRTSLNQKDGFFAGCP